MEYITAIHYLEKYLTKMGVIADMAAALEDILCGLHSMAMMVWRRFRGEEHKVSEGKVRSQEAKEKAQRDILRLCACIYGSQYTKYNVNFVCSAVHQKAEYLRTAASCRLTKVILRLLDRREGHFGKDCKRNIRSL